jgi:hypothetical protein
MARSFHTHELGGLVIGCPACIEQTRAAEQAARWEQAPVRKVTWTCTYNTPGEDPSGPASEVSFTREVRVPDDATPDEVDEHWASITGEAFVLALPDTVPMDHTDMAADTMDVAKVTIGPIVTADPVTVAAPQPGLFDEAIS